MDKVTVSRNGQEYTGACEDLARIFSLMDLVDMADSESPGHTEGDGQNPRAISPPQCRAIKADGERCKHTQLTSRMTNGLCHHHQGWQSRGHNVIG